MTEATEGGDGGRSNNRGDTKRHQDVGMAAEAAAKAIEAIGRWGWRKKQQQQR